MPRDNTKTKSGKYAIGVWTAAAVFVFLVSWVAFKSLDDADPTDDSNVIPDVTGPLTLEEFESNFLIHLDEPLEGKHRECVLREIEARADAAADPETLDPATVEFLPKDSWKELDPEGRRIILMQVITTKAMFECPHFD